MSEYEKLAVWLDAVADAYQRFAIDTYRFQRGSARAGDADLIFAFAEGNSGATATASLARFAAAALRALSSTQTDKLEGRWTWYERCVPDALALAEPLRERMSPQATRRGESKEVADED